MKWIHLADLHLGIRVNGFSMIADQKYVLQEVLDIVRAEKPDAVFVSGDVYDKPVPPAEAVGLFDDFLVRLSALGTQAFIISGNHDSPERLAFGNRLIDRAGIHFSPVYDGTLRPFTLTDEYGPVSIYMLPFVKPVLVRRFFPETEITDCTDAVRTALLQAAPDFSGRNILIAHQFVTGSERSESEELSVGGLDQVDASVFADFDYTALGHIHGPQNAGGEKIRYAGTPLKYSFSEAKHHKSVTVGELREKGSLIIRTVPLSPLREMTELKGSYAELTRKDFYDGTSFREDYVRITLTDEEDIPDAVSRLRVIYRNLMKLDYDNSRTRSGMQPVPGGTEALRSPAELFEDFFRLQNGHDMSAEQSEYIREVTEEIWEADL